MVHPHREIRKPAPGVGRRVVEVDVVRGGLVREIARRRRRCLRGTAPRRPPSAAAAAARAAARRRRPARRRAPLAKKELLPCLPPGVGGRRDRPLAREHHARLPRVLVERRRPRELDLDRARAARVVRRDGVQIRERSLRSCLDQLAGALGRKLAGAELPEAALDRDRGQARRRAARAPRGRPPRPR